jgi:hypothetical protein
VTALAGSLQALVEIIRRGWGGCLGRLHQKANAF